jgi:hypothetical protein
VAISKDKSTINVAIDEDVKKLLTHLYKELRLPSLSNLVSNLIEVSLHDLKIMKITGVMYVGQNLSKAIESVMKRKIFNGHPLSNSENTVTISVTISKETKELLDHYVKELDIPIKKFTRNLIYTALDDYKSLKKTGLIKIAYTFRKYLESHQEFEKNHGRTT